eukprot:gene9547-10552_t
MASRKDGSHLARCYVDDYDRLLQEKVNTFKALLQSSLSSAEVVKDCVAGNGTAVESELNDAKKTDNTLTLPPIEAFESSKEHFRMRANFQMWHDNPNNRCPEGFFYAMFDEADPKTPCEVKNFPRGTQRINELMPLLMQAFHEVPVLFKHLFEVRFLTTKSKQALVVLLYKQPLAPTWRAAAEELAVKLQIKVIGRARKMKQVVGGVDAAGDRTTTTTTAAAEGKDEDETICEVLEVDGQPFSLFQTEGAFSQPNAAVCEKMITWALDVSRPHQSHDLLELYCGGGTFTVPLARRFRQVLATEISKASVELAKRAFRENKIENIQMLRLSSEEFTEFYEGRQDFRRAATSGVKLADYDIRTVLVDPPRAGLDPGTCRLVSKFDNIVYISCNPVTLARDLKVLTESHRIVRLAAFDQFPYTHHLECGVYLTRKESLETAKEEENVDDPPAKKARTD